MCVVVAGEGKISHYRYVIARSTQNSGCAQLQPTGSYPQLQQLRLANNWRADRQERSADQTGLSVAIMHSAPSGPIKAGLGDFNNPQCGEKRIASINQIFGS